MRRFKLLIETIEYPKGLIVYEEILNDERYYVIKNRDSFQRGRGFSTASIEDRPEIWGEMLGKEEGELWPKENDTVFWIDALGQVMESFYGGDERFSQFKWLYFRTREEAQKEILRRQCASRKQEFIPKFGEFYSSINQYGHLARAVWQNDTNDVVMWNLGLVFPPNDMGDISCQEHWAKYKDVFNT